MEIMMVRLNFGDGLDDEFLMYGINKHHMAAAEDALERAKQKYDLRAVGDTFEDVLDDELKKAGVRFKRQGYRVDTVKLGGSKE